MRWLLPRRGGEWADFVASDPAEVPLLDAAAPAEIAGWTGEAALAGGARLAVRLAPFHAERPVEVERSEALQARFGLPAGELWRVELSLAAAAGDPGSAPEAVALAGLAVCDTAGPALAPPFAPDAVSALPADPLRALYAAPPGRLAPGATVPAALWGRAPGDGARLLVAEGTIEVALAPAAFSA
ncbi:MAG: hypothetical protein AB1726_18790, partial [Planctomycetota bacterium]